MRIYKLANKIRETWENKDEHEFKKENSTGKDIIPPRQAV